MVLFRFGALPPARLREAVPGMPRRTFFEVLKRLADRGVLTKSDDGAYDLHTELRAVLSRLAEEQLERTIKKDGEVWLVVRRSDWDRGTEAA